MRLTRLQKGIFYGLIGAGFLAVFVPQAFGYLTMIPAMFKQNGGTA